MENLINNGNFSGGWTDNETLASHVNQRPSGWSIAWLDPGERFSVDLADFYVGAIPEMVHKLSDQLPQNERLGGDDALILSGDATYKIFGTGPWYACMNSKVNLPPGLYRVTFNVWSDTHGASDMWAAVAHIDINGGWQRLNGIRQWQELSQDVFHDGGELYIDLVIANKWPSDLDVFIDDVRLERVNDVEIQDDIEGLQQQIDVLRAENVEMRSKLETIGAIISKYIVRG